MTLFHRAMWRRGAGGIVAAAVVAGGAAGLRARAELAGWMQYVVSGSAIEAALYRAMDLPGVKVLYPRPPVEARAELSVLVTSTPSAAELYAVRARVEEEALDFRAAEGDWRAFAERSVDKGAAAMQLADYYHRRIEGAEEVAALEAAAALPARTDERFVAADRQRAWRSFQRAAGVAREQGLGDDATVAIERAWIAHYPAEPAARAGLLSTLLAAKRYAEAEQAIRDYRAAFPLDTVFATKASALVALQQGTADATARALELFDKAYEPLWPDDLLRSWFELLSATHSQPAMLAAARARLAANPDDLNAATRIFYYYRQQGRLDAATNALAVYGASKAARHAAWSADELYTLATLLERASEYDEAARYYFALASAPGKLKASGEVPEEAALSGAVHLLLAGADSRIALGSGNLAIYRDVATLDRGPGYLNGLLSLWLNSSNPAAEFHEEEQKATPYFHRAKAAELLGVLDRRYPGASGRAGLHAELMEAYIGYGEDGAVRDEGLWFLAEFPDAAQRTEVALEIADADARLGDGKGEFAIYDGLLKELAAGLQGMPLTAGGGGLKAAVGAGVVVQRGQTAGAEGSDQSGSNGDRGGEQAAGESAADNSESGDRGAENGDAAQASKAKDVLGSVLSQPVVVPATSAAAVAYARVLERYLGRLTATNQLPAALAVLRKELDRNPDDPLLYARLADFLQQNDLSAQEEEVYRKAMARFKDAGFYDKLARFYLRQKRQQDYAALTRKVVDIFAGSELESYFAEVHGPWPRVSLQLNLYAHKRFPHDLTFTRNLLLAYKSKPTADAAAWEQLMREHWLESPELEAEFFDYLGRTGRLTGERAALGALVPAVDSRNSSDAVEADAAGSQDGKRDEAAVRELAEIDLWQSRFEQSAPLLSGLAAAYPADAVVGQEAGSVFRSLAYYKPENVERAAAIAKNLSDAEPADLERLASVGDVYADSTSTGLNLDVRRQLATAAPYWRRMAAVHPGVAGGYLESATVFWDYFQFDEALRQLQGARKRFGDPALYGYQAGAIYENKRDYVHAVGEYVGAALHDSGKGGAGADSSAEDRLLTLAGRVETAKAVDKATAAAAEDGSVAALELRASVLAVRKPAGGLAAVLTPLVERAIARAGTADELEALAEFSQQHRLPHEYLAALGREVEAVSDPVQRIEAQYRLAHGYEGQGDVASAQRIFEVVHRDNPEIAGVVRATTDFYWNNKQPRLAVATLVQAAGEANARLARDFRVEAVTKSNQSGDYGGARALLKPLLDADPFNAQYLGLEANSFALAGDAAGLRDFYAGTLAALKTGSLTPTERRDKIALARQGMIVALTDLKDFSGAVEQHIALVSAFPEDANILEEAAAYARLHGREAQLTGFLNKTVAESPRDSRFAVDLARVNVLFEDYEGALAAYTKGIAIRKDRPDLYIARADIEEHRQDYEAACADYERLYVLTYKDSQWMEKSALARARQGRPEAAVKALEGAFIDDRPASAANEFRVAEQLQQWDMLEQARPFVDRGIALAGDGLLWSGEFAGDADIYAAIMGRQRRAAEALALLSRLRVLGGGSASSLGVVLEQAEQQGIASVTDEQWRKQLVARRATQAERSFESAVIKLSGMAAAYYTPEEKLGYAELLDAQRKGKPAEEVAAAWIPAAQAAELPDREAAWRGELLLGGGSAAKGQLDAFDSLEAARMDNRTQAETLDRYAVGLKVARQGPVFRMASEAWRQAGDEAGELRDLRTLVVRLGQPEYQARLFALMLKNDAAGLLKLAAGRSGVGDAAAEFLVEHGTEAQAFAAVEAGATASTGANLAGTSKEKSAGTRREPVWRNSMDALLGLYYGDRGVETEKAFLSVLGPGTVGARLAVKPEKAVQLVGEPWFYYGTRYGVLLTSQAKEGEDAEDYLPAVLEGAPHEAASYGTLAQAYLDEGRYDAAIAEYRHAEELSPADAGANLSIARVLWLRGSHEEAVAEWQRALGKLLAMVDVRAVPESFWTDFAGLAEDARSRDSGAQLKPGMNGVLEAYIRKNQGYRTTELLRAAFGALQGEATGVAVGNRSDEAAEWVLELIGKAGDSDSQLNVLGQLARADWFPEAKRDALFRQEIALAEEADASRGAAAEAQGAAADASGDTIGSVPEESADGPTDAAPDAGSYLGRLDELRVEYMRWLLRQGQTARVRDVFETVPAAARRNEDLQRIEIMVAARESRLPALLRRYESEAGREGAAGNQNEAGSAASLETISKVANALRLEGNFAASRVLLEYVFQQKLARQQLKDTDYLALAEARLATGELAGSLDLLHRMTLIGDFYENLDLATGMLVRTGHAAEALPMLSTLAKGVPWRHDYQLRLGRALLETQKSAEARGALTSVAGSGNARYEDRVEAAEALRGNAGGGAGERGFGSAELTLLSSGVPRGPQAAHLTEQPYFVQARMAAAEEGEAARPVELLRGALLVAPPALEDWLRLRIFQGEIALGHYEQASAAVTPLVAKYPSLLRPRHPVTQLGDGWFRSTGDGTEEISDDGAGELAEDRTGGASSGRSGELVVGDAGRDELYSVEAAVATDAARVELVLALASTDEHLGDQQSAVRELRAAAEFTADKAQAATLLARANGIEARIALAQENAGRRPVISATVNQSVLVRPRRIAAGEPAPQREQR